MSTESQELDTQSQAIEQVNSGSISLTDLLKVIAGKPKPFDLPEKLPLPAILSDQEKEALAHLPEVFGAVVPDTKRRITLFELPKMLEERLIIDRLVKMLMWRSKHFRTTFLNHFDVEAEDKGLVDEDTQRDSDGHYLVPNEVAIPDSRHRFTWEIAQGAPFVSVSKLKEMSEDPDSGFTRADYLALTEVPKPARVLSEEKTLAAIKENPGLLEHLVKAVTPGRLIGSFHLRNLK